MGLLKKTMKFSKEQVELLKEPILAKNVKERDGNRDGTFQLAFVEGWHVIAEANRIFGFDGWNSETIETTCVQNEPNFVTYIAKVRITVGDVVREGTGAGHGNQKSGIGNNHEAAIKEAETDARKRAFMQFGNQFGLSLYNGKDKSWKKNIESQVNKGEVIETLREQVSEIAETPQNRSTFLLAKVAVETAQTLDQLLDHKKNIAIRFRDGKLTQNEKSELDNLVAKTGEKLK